MASQEYIQENIVDQTLFDLKLNEAQFYAEQGLFDEADRIYIYLINELKKSGSNKNVSIQVNQLELLRKDLSGKIAPAGLAQKKTEKDDCESCRIESSSDSGNNYTSQAAYFSDDEYLTESQIHSKVLSTTTSFANSDSYTGLSDEEADKEVASFINDLIVSACHINASSIHIEPDLNSGKSFINFKVEGVFRQYSEIANPFSRKLIFRLRTIANMGGATRGVIENGKFKFRDNNTSRPIEVEVISIPTACGREDLCLKICRRSEPVDLSSLITSEDIFSRITECLKHKSGLIIISGPADSDKSVMLHSVVRSIKSPERKIKTVEKSVHIIQPGVSQSEVRDGISTEYSSFIKAFVQTGADTIMVETIPDFAVASIAVDISANNKMVIAGFNAADSLDAIRKILEMGVDPIKFADSLLCVISQKKLKRLCNGCKIASGDTAESLLEIFPEHIKNMSDPGDYNGEIFQSSGNGCSECGYTGYNGIITVHEILVNNEEIKMWIKESLCSSYPQRESGSSRFRKIDFLVKKIINYAFDKTNPSMESESIVEVISGHTSISEIS